MLYQEMFRVIESEFYTRSIVETDIPLFKSLFNKFTVISILEDILSQPQLLEKIANRSYTHALGFDKIILADLSKDSTTKLKNQVRLHIWEPEANALPIVEALHEHSFDFISTVLTGHLENQRFLMSDLDEQGKSLLKKLQDFISSEFSTSQEVDFINSQIEILEALKLKDLGSKQFDDLDMQASIDIKRMQKLLGLNIDEILNLTTLEGHYVSNRVAGEKKDYAHILKEYVCVKAQDVLHIDAGQYYYHPYTLAHRLYYNNKILNSTILVTTHVADNPEGGSLQRPSYVQATEQKYDKIGFTPQTMRAKLEGYIRFLKAWSYPLYFSE